MLVNYCSDELETTFVFYSRCEAAVDKEVALMRYYFECEIYYSVILQFFNKYHAIEIFKYAVLSQQTSRVWIEKKGYEY